MKKTSIAALVMILFFITTLIGCGTNTGEHENAKGKSVDAVVVNEPTVSVSLKQGYAKVLVWAADEINTQSGAIFFSPKFAANKDAGVRFLKAYLKAARFYYDAVLVKKDGQLAKGQNYDEVVKIVAKYSDQDENIIKGSLSFNDPNGKLNVDDIKSQIDWYAKEKMISKPINAEDIINTEMLEEALNSLGK
jgi:NitT/TauT family transport system substrate-binding protein